MIFSSMVSVRRKEKHRLDGKNAFCHAYTMHVLKTIKQMLLYTSVGGVATLVDWSFFYLFAMRLHIFYLVAALLAFGISTFVNWACGRLFLFRHAVRADFVLWEIAKVYLTNLLGLALNLLIMWIAVERCSVHKMLAKVIATSLVFFWNFSIRKLYIYKI